MSFILSKYTHKSRLQSLSSKHGTTCWHEACAMTSQAVKKIKVLCHSNRMNGSVAAAADPFILCPFISSALSTSPVVRGRGGTSTVNSTLWSLWLPIAAITWWPAPRLNWVQCLCALCCLMPARNTALNLWIGGLMAVYPVHWLIKGLLICHW